jgi:hypothetical protein
MPSLKSFWRLVRVVDCFGKSRTSYDEPDLPPRYSDIGKTPSVKESKTSVAIPCAVDWAAFYDASLRKLPANPYDSLPVNRHVFTAADYQEEIQGLERDRFLGKAATVRKRRVGKERGRVGR